MGRTIEALGIKQGHSFPVIIDKDNSDHLTAQKLKGIDAAIEFSSPAAAPGNILTCINLGVPVVSGTTGWNEKIPEIEASCLEKRATLFHASNYSIGVNILFAMNRKLAEIMKLLNNIAGANSQSTLNASKNETSSTQILYAQKTRKKDEKHVNIQSAYPTEQRQLAKEKKARFKAEGKEFVVVQKKKIVENHYDDCGACITSLTTDLNEILPAPAEPDKEQNTAHEYFIQSFIVYEDDISHHERFFVATLEERRAKEESRRIRPEEVKKATPGGQPISRGTDHRFPGTHATTCRGCRACRRRDDWEHTRVVGDCKYPYDEPVLPDCIACQRRLHRDDSLHTLKEGCFWEPSQPGLRIREATS